MICRLTSLQSLNLSDCVNLTDRAVLGLAERCRKLVRPTDISGSVRFLRLITLLGCYVCMWQETLVLRGCDRLTEKAVLLLGDAGRCTGSSVALCDALKAT